jgi:K+-sensing histidine kinase KdpD
LTPTSWETQLATSLNGEAVATSILEAARANRCGTVVIGRESFPWLKELFQHHMGDELIRRGRGLAIWVIEAAAGEPREPCRGTRTADPTAFGWSIKHDSPEANCFVDHS